MPRASLACSKVAPKFMRFWTSEKAGALMDSVLRFMKQHDVPVTRENYLDVAYLGNPPEELSAEEEAELPEQFQVWDTDEDDL